MRQMLLLISLGSLMAGAANREVLLQVDRAFGRAVAARGADKNGKSTVSRGKYITVWRKGAGGAWKVVADIGNATPPKPAN